ncbi:S1 RNA-binding domain-containing protein 1-like isoform X2 [Neocloeon triangulifer]|uniref:S1 RNA-binding domain-containing protein 1-like isoform X2 n=1 Tax=Neocloeon triangulifer TaxID=2078957 RepID=UPI00286F2E2F|nr:S1 RNA-binding domain-containing protein 1-like isoform X2 [Neocloeon triangulifer]
MSVQRWLKYTTCRSTKRSYTNLPTGNNDYSNATINLDESDRDSVIEVSPIRATSSKDNVLRVCRTQSSNAPLFVNAKNTEASVKIPDFLGLAEGPSKKKKRVTSQSVSPAKPALNRNVAKAALKNLPESQHQIPKAPAGKMKNTAGRKRKNSDTSVQCLDLVDNKGSKINGNQIAPTQKAPNVKRPPLKAKRRNQNCSLPTEKASPRKELPKAPPSVPLKPQRDNDDDDCIVIWESADVLCRSQNIAPNVAKNLVTLFDNENTIPFIARYRRGLTNNMEAEQLRIVRDAYEELKIVREKAKTVINKVRTSGQLTKALKKRILATKSISELEDIMEQFKTPGKGTLAERARSVGLEEPALQLLHGTAHVDLYSLVQPNTDGLKNVKEVELGLQHIIAEVVSKHEKILEFSRNGRKGEFYIKSKEMKITKKSLLDKKKHEKNVHKFKEFFDYNNNVKNIRPHTTMALNRGENLKILSVKIEALPIVKTFFNRLCQGVFLSSGVSSAMRWNICKAAFEDAWDRLVFPAIARQTRAELTKKGEKESLDVFASNLKQILLAPPLKGATVMGMDPGFLNGCKVAIVSPSGEVKHTDVIHPPLNGDPFGPAAKKVCDMVKKFGVKVLALGDGTASAETSAWLGSLIEAKAFHPLDVSYTVVCERGASVYSCSPVAKEEFPSMDPNKISAVSIARRLQEPLAELVKVEPKHLGVGMYQHDLPESKLKLTLDEVVQECVSFVGVDVNTASLYLLQRVAGLNETKAKNLLQWRNANGPFTSRQQLLEVKGIGPKAFQQCAGFIRVIPCSRAGSLTENKSQATSKTKVKIEKGIMPNLLDSTNVHPEAYSSALELMKLIGVELEDLGKTGFIRSINKFLRRKDMSRIAKKIKVESEQAVLQLAEALTQGPAYDIRVKNSGPVFRRGCTKIEDVKCGENFTGSVQNVTPFGAFIDIGVGTAGLLHTSKMRGTALQVGHRVEVKVMTVDLQRKRIGLDFQYQ